MTIELTDYFAGVDTTEVPTEHVAAAGELLARVNTLLVAFLNDHQDWPLRVNSGYRTIAHNASVPGAAPNSNHTTGRAIDIGDDIPRTLAQWCLLNYRECVRDSLYCEDFRATPTWVHFQSVPPRSGIRFYMPTAEWAAKLSGTPLTAASLAAHG